MKKKVGFFGGTFDPIHFGHLNLAQEIMHKKKLDEVWFCPSQWNPHKEEDHPCATASQRAEMVRIALEGFPQFHLCEAEIRRPGPSYTVDTLRRLSHDHPDILFYLILGMDALQGFHRWKAPEEIVALAKPVVGFRPGTSIEIPESFSDHLKEKFKGAVLPIKEVPISATEIRACLAKGDDCSHFLPPKVLDYIITHKLYSIV